MKKVGILRLLTLLVAMASLFGIISPASARPTTGPYSIPDYFETPNWAYSPSLTKFVDDLAPLGCDSPTATLGQCIPIAVPDTISYPGSDYYEIEVVQFREQMHSEFDPIDNPDKMAATSGGTLLRGYRQVNTLDNNLLTPHYLGPIIIAKKDRPVRIKFTNKLPTGTAGNLFVPVDQSIMGSAEYDIDYDPVTMEPITPRSGVFTENRALLHLHGGRTPWISDGTPHQWVVPTGESLDYPRGVSAKNAPDMADPGSDSINYYYTNHQSARLMFYHDHAWGITRLNVYVGMAAGYVITDDMETAMVEGGIIDGRTYAAETIPSAMIPLVIQDKTFVDATTIAGLDGSNPLWDTGSDPTWRWGSNPVPIGSGGPYTATPTTGDLWWPHVYMPAQNPFAADGSGIAAFGRWHYGPWFFPSTPVCNTVPGAVKPFCVDFGPVPNVYDGVTPDQPPEMPGTPNVSWGAEAFLDTMMVNGTVYPKLAVLGQKYRLRILNASHDRFLNLQLYVARPIVQSISVNPQGSGYSEDTYVVITPNALDTTGGGAAYNARGATATPVIDPVTGAVTAINIDTVGSGYAHTPTVEIIDPNNPSNTTAAASAAIYTELTEVGMVPAAPTPGFPASWPKDGREGGVPDPGSRGPALVQIANEGGFLPAPVVLPNQPISWNLDPTLFNVGNVLDQAQGGGTVILGPAERADVVVDFAGYEGSTLILYNDAPTAFPALDPHYDFYTGAPERSEMGGYPLTIPPGVGPNIRTVMQINVAGGGTAGDVFQGAVNHYDTTSFDNLTAAFTHDVGNNLPGAFESGQDEIVVGQADYDATYDQTYPTTYPLWGVSRISDGAISFVEADNVTQHLNFNMKPKAIHDEMGATFDDYGRMSAKLGLEMPFTNAAIANFILQNFVDPSTEIIDPAVEPIQIWRITHNGVDSHPVHFHLFDVQVLNRVAWDGFIRLPDPNELGWKDTVRMNPLEDTIVALRPVVPPTPFGVPRSIRPLNPRYPLGSTEGFSQIDTTDGGNLTPPQENVMTDFDNEYVWHCHILSHEENDMMRTVQFKPIREVPAAFTLTANGTSLDWIDNTPAPPVDGSTPPNLIDNGTMGNPANEVGFRVEHASGIGDFTTLGYALANATTYPTDTTGAERFRVVAFNAEGDTASNVVFGDLADTVTITSAAYNADTDTVSVRATSSSPGVTMRLSVTTGGSTVQSTMKNLGGGSYSKSITGITTLPDSVTVTSSGGGMDTTTVPFPSETVTITSAAYNADTDVVSVRAISTLSDSVLTLTATTGGSTVQSVMKNLGGGSYSKSISSLTTLPDSVTVTSNRGATDTATVPFPSETVTITSVVYNADTDIISVRATSTLTGSALTLTVTTGGSSVQSAMKDLGGGSYSKSITGVTTQPDSVTVTSSRGATDTAPVP